MRSCPKPAPRPGVNDTTRVMKQAPSNFCFEAPVGPSTGDESHPIPETSATAANTVLVFTKHITALLVLSSKTTSTKLRNCNHIDNKRYTTVSGASGNGRAT